MQEKLAVVFLTAVVSIGPAIRFTAGSGTHDVVKAVVIQSGEKKKKKKKRKEKKRKEKKRKEKKYIIK